MDASGFAQRHLHYRGCTGPEAHLIGARAATADGRYPMAMATLEDLGQQEGQREVAMLEMLRIDRARSGPEAAARRLEKSDIDLADPAQIQAVRMLADAYLPRRSPINGKRPRFVFPTQSVVA